MMVISPAVFKEDTYSMLPNVPLLKLKSHDCKRFSCHQIIRNNRCFVANMFGTLMVSDTACFFFALNVSQILEGHMVPMIQYVVLRAFYQHTKHSKQCIHEWHLEIKNLFNQ